MLRAAANAAAHLFVAKGEMMVYDSVTELVDILILTKVIDTGDDAVQSTSALTPVIGIVGLYYGIWALYTTTKRIKRNDLYSHT